MFETDDEKRQRQQKYVLLSLSILFFLGVIMLGLFIYDQVKPLPQTKVCERAGYEAGENIDGIDVCYNSCETNKLSSCKNRGFPR